MADEIQAVELYRRFRPTNFSELVGQSAAVAQLKDMGMNKRIPHCLLFRGPSGCLRGDSIIYDPVDKSQKTIQQRYMEGFPFHVLSLNAVGVVEVGIALPPVMYSPAPIFRVETDISVFFATGEHQLFLSESMGYQSVAECALRLQPYGEVRLLSSLGCVPIAPQQDGSHCREIERDFQGGCPVCFCSYDERPLYWSNVFQESFQQRDGVQVYECRSCGFQYNRPLSHISHLSKTHFYPHNSPLVYSGSSFVSGICELPFELCQYHQPLPALTSQEGRVLQQVDLLSQRLMAEHVSYRGCVDRRLLACNPPTVGDTLFGWTSIKSITPVGQEEYYDFHVLGYNNYWMGGVFHHNCGKTSAARILRTKLGCADADFYEINASEDGGIGMVRNILDKIGLAPMAGPCKVYLLDEFHRASDAAQHSLLKILEDTPRHVYFILATTDPEKIKKTIITRCTEIVFSAVPKGDLVALIKSVVLAENIVITDDVVDRIADVAEGSARKSLVVLHAVRGIADSIEQMKAVEVNKAGATGYQLAQLICKRGAAWKEVAAILKKIHEGKEDPDDIRRIILGYARAILVNSGAAHAAMVIEEFRENLWETKHAGLAAACFAVVNSK